MKWRAVIGSLIVLLVITGCGGVVRPKPGMSAVVLEINAIPKSGPEQPFRRVSGYDAGAEAAAPTGAFEQVDYATLGDIIVWLEPGPVTMPTRAPLAVAIDVAHPSSDVNPASIGQQVVFQNRSGKPISLYSVSDDNDFTLPSIAPGGTGAYIVRGEGLIEVLADPSQPPVALIYAAPSAWVARGRSGKTVAFNDVPPGSYRAVAWHPRLPGSSIDLNLPAGEVVRAPMEIGVRNLASFQK